MPTPLVSVPSALALATTNLPAFTVTAPVPLFAPAIVKVPVPIFASVPELVTVPEKVLSVFRFPMLSVTPDVICRAPEPLSSPTTIAVFELYHGPLGELLTHLAFARAFIAVFE